MLMNKRQLHQLRSFLVAAERLHFGEAADEMGISQSALSPQISGLEKALGVSLFDRTTRRVRLTSAGEVYREKSSAGWPASTRQRHEPKKPTLARAAS